MPRKVTWSQLLKVCKSHDIAVYNGHGGEKKLKGLGADGTVRVMVIGYKCTKSRHSTIYVDYVKAFQRRFGVSSQELFDE